MNKQEIEALKTNKKFLSKIKDIVEGRATSSNFSIRRRSIKDVTGLQQTEGSSKSAGIVSRFIKYIIGKKLTISYQLLRLLGQELTQAKEKTRELQEQINKLPLNQRAAFTAEMQKITQQLKKCDGGMDELKALLGKANFKGKTAQEVKIMTAYYEGTFQEENKAINNLMAQIGILQEKIVPGEEKALKQKKETLKKDIEDSLSRLNSLQSKKFNRERFLQISGAQIRLTQMKTEIEGAKDSTILGEFSKLLEEAKSEITKWEQQLNPKPR